MLIPTEKQSKEAPFDERKLPDCQDRYAGLTSQLE